MMTGEIRKMTSWMLAAAVAAMAAFWAEAAPASKMKVKMADMYVAKAEKDFARFGTKSMTKNSTREARQRLDDLLKASADDPDVVALDERLKKVEGAFNAEAKKWDDAQKAHDEKVAAEKKAAEEAKAAKAASLAHKVELPWVMAKEDREAINKYIDELGRTTNSKLVGDFKKVIDARAEEDRRIVEANGDEADKAKDELSLYTLFLDQLGHQTIFRTDFL